MAQNKCKVSDLDIKLKQVLEGYGESVAAAVKRDVKAVAKETVTTLKQTSPKDTGEYAKSWKSTVTAEKSNEIAVTVHNVAKKSLTHILEKGHAKVNGGRVEGRPHIAPAEQAAAEKLEQLIAADVKGVG